MCIYIYIWKAVYIFRYQWFISQGHRKPWGFTVYIFGPVESGDWHRILDRSASLDLLFLRVPTLSFHLMISMISHPCPNVQWFLVYPRPETSFPFVWTGTTRGNHCDLRIQTKRCKSRMAPPPAASEAEAFWIRLRFLQLLGASKIIKSVM